MRPGRCDPRDEAPAPRRAGRDRGPVHAAPPPQRAPRPARTGVALVDRDGGHELLKRPLPAREFVALDLYREVLGELSNRTTCILGHTRWPTRGTPAEPLNNQPIRRGRTLGTHNGTILNSTPLALAHGIRRLCQVDTEILVFLADEAADLEAFLGRLRAAWGELAAVLVRLDWPGEVILIRYVNAWWCVYASDRISVLAGEARRLSGGAWAGR